MNNLTCPFCNEQAELQRLNPEFWVIKCINGECEELPEVMSHSKDMALKIWRGELDWKQSQRGCVQCVLKDKEIERLNHVLYNVNRRGK